MPPPLNCPVHVRLLLGPAGSGKTHRCLAEVCAALCAHPEGSPLLFLAPKQATYQLERQVLADPAVPAFTRLQILSFDRLAARLLDTLHRPPPPLLAEEGRRMVLRALLARERDHLTVFRASARLTGFAAELSELLRRFQRHQVGAARLTRLAREAALPRTLRDKLADLARLLAAYQAWLADHQLEDADSLLDAATRALHEARRRGAAPALGGLWLDGFAEMTPQELDLLVALLPGVEQATLAFCLDPAGAGSGHGLSPWSPVLESLDRLRERLRALPQCEVIEEALSAAPDRGRFARAPALFHLERHWALPRPWKGTPPDCLQLVSCADPEQEVTEAAREILWFVRHRGARYRDVAVLMRSLEGHHELVRRVFRRYGLPFFLDRRESVAHHPLAELTRSALRTVAYGWQHADWFSALKTGLVPAPPAALDHLENEALARGWEGSVWLEPLDLPEDRAVGARLEALRQQVVPPFERLARALATTPTSGTELAAAVRAFWAALAVDRTLAEWAARGEASPRDPAALEWAAVHRAVREQLDAWLDNVARAFPTERLPLREWLPVLEAGLAHLSVGVIPPALDQVLVGAVDRSRNPDLRLVIVLGLNEGLFPAPPAASPLLAEAEQRTLADHGLDVGPDRTCQTGREHYLGYIAATRARERLVLTWARTDAAGRALGESAWIARLRRLFPQLPTETAAAPAAPAACLHPVELVGAGLRREALSDPAVRQGLQAAGWSAEHLTRWSTPPAAVPERLAPGLAARLYGAPGLRVSVSRLERFAACPFQFFVSFGLRAEERRRFAVDARQRGSFQHELLRRFHEVALAERGSWRAFTPEEARQRIGQLADSLKAEFGGGVLEADEVGAVNARALTRQVQDHVADLLAWMHRGYDFNPLAAELAFGGRDGALPAWTLPLPGERYLALSGQVDRVDVAQDPATGALWCVVLDYKAGTHQFDPLLFRHGIQLQLPAYLAALCALGLPTPPPAAAPDPPRSAPAGPDTAGPPPALRPAGLFYVNLRGQRPPARSRSEVVGGSGGPASAPPPLRGRFSVAALDLLDGRPSGEPSGQFAYRLNAAGTEVHRGGDALSAEDFDALITATREQLIRQATRILGGVVAVDPFQKGASLRACDVCRFAAICRIDPAQHRFRRLT